MQRAQIWIVIHAIREVSDNQQIFRKDHDPLSNLGYDEVWETTSPNIDCNALGSALRARLHGAGPAPQLVGKCWLKVRGNVVGSARGDVSLSWKRWLHRCSQRGPRRLASRRLRCCFEAWTPHPGQTQPASPSCRPCKASCAPFQGWSLLPSQISITLAKHSLSCKARYLQDVKL